ncbi:hypothetical protein ANCDUO_19626 [Ancylostoma duodenale]|uniref:Uncharacterized protein n=1 Tax=Ancylostoma duodenale TaxID=51022 RepID=A0A0C2FNX3_9BILA|nr:hypothetical protein ANCDUO_19626 [Ancylostoma duodenale]
MHMVACQSDAFAFANFAADISALTVKPSSPGDVAAVDEVGTADERHNRRFLIPVEKDHGSRQRGRPASYCGAFGVFGQQEVPIYRVGSEGFLKALPVFLDNILSPVLSNSHFATEIHHINGKGEDAGVVYCETQGHESEMLRIIDRKTKEIMYPPNNPYRVDVGGRPKNLRETCSLDRLFSAFLIFFL